MLGKIIEYWKEMHSLKAIFDDPVASRVTIIMSDTLTDQKFLLSKTTIDFKQKLANDVLANVARILESNDQFIENRNALSESVLVFAQHGVLIIDKQSEKDPWAWLGEIRGISGELKHHVKHIAKKNKEIRELIWGISSSTGIEEPSEKNIYDACRFNAEMAWLRINVFNAIRILQKDYHIHEERDWLNPFIAAMCIWYEHRYREELELPDLFGENSTAWRR